jgi:[acyl-carrier-protein] S-malonyltransferase
MGRIAFIFPGQGSQAVGMGKSVYENYPAARAVLDQADTVLGYKISELCFNGPAERLQDTRNAQPAILAISAAIYQILQTEGIRPDCVAGHSLGEYSALVAAEAIVLDDALKLVAERSRLMARADPAQQGTMAAILGMDRASLAECLKEASLTGKVEAANYNCPGQIVVSGAKTGIAKLQELVAGGGGKFIPLSVSGPFHSSFMKQAAEEFRPYLEKARWRRPLFPLIANVSAQPVCREALPDSLYRQVFSPVLWEDTVNYLFHSGVATFVEVGPGRVLSGLTKKTLKGVTILNCEDSDSTKKALAILKEV